MRQISPLEQEYKKLTCQASPDLWSRIEGNLKDHPEREVRSEGEEKADRKAGRSRRRFGVWSGGGVIAAAAAAVLLLITAGTHHGILMSVGRREEARAGRSEAFPGQMNAAETRAFAGEDSLEGDETVDLAKAAEPDGKEAQDSAKAAEPEGKEAQDSVKAAGTERKEEGRVSSGVLLYSQLGLGDYESLSLSSQAAALPEDTVYFTEEVLEDTELLCQGTVMSVSLETDEAGTPSLLSYEINVDLVCYSDNYTTGLTRIQVKSPIVKAVGGDHQILYQLQAGSSYVLPLKRAEGGWELLFPFAPQIQAAPEGGYLFHSGYASLADDRAFVVVGQQEGANDFYYDRMLLRRDDDFLSDLVILVADRSSNGKKES